MEGFTKRIVITLVMLQGVIAPISAYVDDVLYQKFEKNMDAVVAKGKREPNGYYKLKSFQHLTLYDMYDNYERYSSFKFQMDLRYSPLYKSDFERGFKLPKYTFVGAKHKSNDSEVTLFYFVPKEELPLIIYKQILDQQTSGTVKTNFTVPVTSLTKRGKMWRFSNRHVIATYGYSYLKLLPLNEDVLKLYYKSTTGYPDYTCFREVDDVCWSGEIVNGMLQGKGTGICQTYDDGGRTYGNKKYFICFEGEFNQGYPVGEITYHEFTWNHNTRGYDWTRDYGLFYTQSYPISLTTFVEGKATLTILEGKYSFIINQENGKGELTKATRSMLEDELGHAIWSVLQRTCKIDKDYQQMSADEVCKWENQYILQQWPEKFCDELWVIKYLPSKRFLNADLGEKMPEEKELDIYDHNKHSSDYPILYDEKKRSDWMMSTWAKVFTDDAVRQFKTEAMPPLHEPIHRSSFSALSYLCYLDVSDEDANNRSRKLRELEKRGVKESREAVKWLDLMDAVHLSMSADTAKAVQGLYGVRFEGDYNGLDGSNYFPKLDSGLVAAIELGQKYPEFRERCKKIEKAINHWDNHMRLIEMPKAKPINIRRKEEVLANKRAVAETVAKREEEWQNTHGHEINKSECEEPSGGLVHPGITRSDYRYRNDGSIVLKNGHKYEYNVSFYSDKTVEYYYVTDGYRYVSERCKTLSQLIDAIIKTDKEK